MTDTLLASLAPCGAAAVSLMVSREPTARRDPSSPR